MRQQTLFRFTMLSASLVLLATPAALAQSDKYGDRDKATQTETAGKDMRRKTTAEPQLQKRRLAAERENQNSAVDMFQPEKEKAFPRDMFEPEKKAFPGDMFEPEREKAFPDSTFDGQKAAAKHRPK